MEIYRQITRQLTAAYPDREAQALARMVMEERYNLSQTDLLLDKDSNLSADDHTELTNIVNRLLQHEPIQYVLGTARFCGRDFHVEPGVLIPRPETEELVQLIVRRHAKNSKQLGVLDIGTGSGCIAISLALELPLSGVSAWDISQEALHIAQGNAERLHAEVEFKKEDILHPEPTSQQWDIIVSNPPYVRRLEAREMDPNVLDYEPHLALFVPDDDALRFYRAIARFAGCHLSAGGQLYLEINQYLPDETARLIAEYGFSSVEIHTDQFGNKRILSCSKA